MYITTGQLSILRWFYFIFIFKIQPFLSFKPHLHFR
jgi:hypothetical protein